jgi:hypothetical protein
VQTITEKAYDQVDLICSRLLQRRHRQTITLLNQADLIHLPRSYLSVAAAAEEEAGVRSRAAATEEADVCAR